MKTSAKLPKQFLPIGGIPILAHSLMAFERSELVDEIVLVTGEELRSPCEKIVHRYHIQKLSTIVAGGQERQASVWNGLQTVNPQTEIVVIHDAVRMFVTEAMLVDSVREARIHGACVVAVPVKDTIKQGVVCHPEEEDVSGSSGEVFVKETFDRNALWQIQTPQTFRCDLIRDLHKRAAALQLQVTDDAMLAEHFGHAVKIVSGSYRNIKITTPDDLLIAEAFWQDERGN